MFNHPDVCVKRGFSNNPDEQTAIAQLYDQIAQHDAVLTVIFASSKFDLSILGPCIKKFFGDNVIGCTTSGEITPQGYKNGTVCGFSISGSFEAYPFLINGLSELGADQIEDVSKKVNEITLRAKVRGFSSFGLLLIDGLSMMEERLVAMLANALGDIPIAGGSAGDDRKFEKTSVYHKGTFGKDAAIYCLCTTNVPFKPLKTQHFVSTERRMVITRANVESRLVYEINGNGAAEEFARQLGIDIKELSFNHFSKYPLLMRFGEQNYVRSIQKANADGSLTFFCAIDEGMVLRLAAKTDIVENLRNTLARCCGNGFEAYLTIGFDCIHRKMEIEEMGVEQEIETILSKYNTIGFCTYGEQYNSIHVNQTFTGIILGKIT